ncbi:MAG TPA: aminoglycoside phosphotransferase family protein [Pseudomonadales bacterium]
MADRQLTRAGRALADGWRLTAGLAPLGEGHINDTLLATTATSERFVLQRINQTVFADPERVMGNLLRVIRHLETRSAGLLPGLVATRSGAFAHVDTAGDWWRLWHYVPDGRSLGRTSDPAVCAAAGEAFGRFQRLLADLPGPALEPTIPGFLELAVYLERFDTLARGAQADASVADACGSMAFVDAHRNLAARFPKQQDLIHGDCKLNNLIFAAAEPRVLAVLDLDTVMVGHWAWDLGDLARSVLMGTRAPEQARSALDALCAGFAAGSGRRQIEPQVVIAAAAYVTFMLGIRFLTDHLEGDRYFRVDRRGENLERAREQFQLLRRLDPGSADHHLAPPVRPGR